MNKLSANQLQEILHRYGRLRHPWEFIDYLRANSKPDNSLVSEEPLPSVNWRDGKPYNYCPECGREEPSETTHEMVELYELTKHDGSSTLNTRMDYGEHGEPALTETDEEIAQRMIERWVDYMNENEPDPTGAHRIPPKLKEWLSQQESEG